LAPPITEDVSGETADFLARLRQIIVRSRCGDCLTAEQLAELYGAIETATTDGPLLAHIVSCPDCLDQINKLLGLPPLADRYPMDMIGPDAPSGRELGKTKPSASSANPVAKICHRK